MDFIAFSLSLSPRLICSLSCLHLWKYLTHFSISWASPPHKKNGFVHFGKSPLFCRCWQPEKASGYPFRFWTWRWKDVLYIAPIIPWQKGNKHCSYSVVVICYPPWLLFVHCDKAITWLSVNAKYLSTVSSRSLEDRTTIKHHKAYALLEVVTSP